MGEALSDSLEGGGKQSGWETRGQRAKEGSEEKKAERPSCTHQSRFGTDICLQWKTAEQQKTSEPQNALHG